jgi:hypothetical protein
VRRRLNGQHAGPGWEARRADAERAEAREGERDRNVDVELAIATAEVDLMTTPLGKWF